MKNKPKLVSKIKMSELITGGDYINKLARISYYTNLSFKQLEDTHIEFNQSGEPYLVHSDIINTIKPLHDEIKSDISAIINELN